MSRFVPASVAYVVLLVVLFVIVFVVVIVNAKGWTRIVGQILLENLLTPIFCETKIFISKFIVL